MLKAPLTALLCALLIGACAQTIDIQPGASVAEIQAQFGRQTGSYALPDGGKRLEFAFSGGPRTFMVDVDPSGRMVSWRQVLDVATFNTIAAGTPRETVLMTIGRPSQIRPGGRQGGEVWSYHFQNTQCLWMQLAIGADGRTMGQPTTSILPACMNAP